MAPAGIVWRGRLLVLGC